MAIIYSYPTVNPERTDLILGTDVSTSNKATKNFTVQSIIDLVTVATGDLQTVLDLGNVATGRDINLTDNSFRGASFITKTGGVISGTTATGFTNITSTAFTGTLATAAQPNVTSLGTLSALVISGPISGTGLITNSNLTGAQNDNVVSTLAIKTYVDNKVGLFDTLSEVLANGNTTGATKIEVDNTNSGIDFIDDAKLRLGTGNDFEIYHAAADNKTYLKEAGAGDLEIWSNKVAIKNAAGNEALLNATENAAVELYFDNAKKIETLSGGAKVTGAFQATTSGTFASLINTGTYSDSSGDVGNAGQILSSTGSGTNWVTEVPLYNWSLEGTAIPSGTAVTVTDGTNITTTWDATNFDLTIATTGVPDGSGGANQVTYWSDADTLTGATGFTFAGGATGKVAIAGELEVGGVLTDGTFTGSAGTYTGYASITSTVFVGALTGNASTATALATSGAIALTGDTTSTGGPYTYTSGGALSIATTIADTTVTGKVLTNLPTPTSSAIAASDSILAAMAKLQGQITSTTGLAYEGTWDARNSAEGGSSDGGNPDLTQASTKVNGHFYIVSTAGNAEPNGATGTQLSPWAVGDWVIYVANGSATDEWQKLDQSNEVLGSGAANKIAKWTSPNTLATGLIADDGTTVTVGNSGNLVVEGNTTLGDADTDSTTVKGPAVFEETVRINEGISLGANTYGVAGQVLTSGGGSSSVNTWTTPTVGTVTSVTAGTGITIGGTAAAPTVAIDYLGTDNAILSAPQENAIATTDTVWFSDATDNNIKKTTVANLIALDPARSLSAVLAVGNTSGANDILMADSQSVKFGAGNDLQIIHNGTDSQINNFTGNLQFTQLQDDGDISFASDNGSGGDTIYFQLDGGQAQSRFLQDVKWDDDKKAKFGTSDDLRLYHNGTTNNSNIENYTGDLYFTQNTDDGDIIFRNDDGSGGVTEYFRLDGSAVETYFSKSTLLFDNVKAKFGDGSDLQIYHDGSNSYIQDVGTGNLNITSNGGSVQINKGSTENMAEFIVDGAVNLYYDSAKKFETTSTGVTVTGATTLGGNVLVQGNVNMDGYYISDVEEIRFDQGSNQAIIASPSATTLELKGANVSITGGGSNPVDGNLTVAGNLTVDGHIIHGGGGGGTGKGGQFTKLFTSQSGGSVAFTIDRATTGTMVFDVMFTSDTSTTTSIAKKYTVIATYGATAPLYNKILDSGPDANNADFTVAFADDTSNTKIKCTITPVTTAVQKIGITIDLGFGQNDATVVMN